jgi:hypothetical protein
MHIDCESIAHMVATFKRALNQPKFANFVDMWHQSA